MSVPTPEPIQWAEEAALALASAAGSAIAYVVSAWLANIRAGRPDMPMAEITEALAKQMADVNGMAWSIGDKAMADLATQHAGIEIPELGLTPPDGEEGRLADAVDVIFGGEHEKLVARMDRIATAEPLRATKRSLQTAMKKHGVEEWRRVVMPQACEACASRVGEVRSIEVLFTDHPGCRCTLSPVIAKTWGDEVKQQQLQLRSVSPSGVRFSSGLVFGNIEKGASK